MSRATTQNSRTRDALQGGLVARVVLSLAVGLVAAACVGAPAGTSGDAASPVVSAGR